MQEIEDFLNSKETYDKVLNYLKTYDNKNLYDAVTSDGGTFIAGGSVSNILISLLHGGRPVINDIDIYRGVMEEINGRTAEQWYPATFVNEDGMEIVDDNYGRVYVAENGARMRVIKHTRKNVFNIIDYLYEDWRRSVRSPKTKEMVILEGFDLNCCKSGLDIINQKIVYTPEFVEFLQTKELKVINPCSPIQTTIRLHKKMKDLDCTCDILHEVRFLTVAFHKIQNESHLTRFIGPETYSKYLAMRDCVDKYFRIRKPNLRGELPYYLQDKKDSVNVWIYEPILNFDIVEDAYSINQLKRIWELLYRPKSGEDQDKINKIYYKGVFLGTNNEDTWSRRVYKNNDLFSDEYETIASYHSERFTFQMLMSKKDYYNCDFDLSHVDFLDEFTRIYYDLRFFLKDCNTLQEQLNMLIFINDLRLKNGDWVFDFLGNIRRHRFALSNLFGYDKIMGKGVVCKEKISDVVEKEKIFREIPKMLKLEISKFKFKKW